MENGRVGQRWRRTISGHVLGAITLALSLALLWLAWMFARPLALLVAAIVLANALEPVVDYLLRWMRRTFAIATITVTAFAALAVAGLVIVPNVASQVDDVASTLPSLIERGREIATQWVPLTGGLGQSILQPSGNERGSGNESSGSGGSSQLTSLPLMIVSSAFEAVLVVFLSLYWLAAMPTIRAFLLSLIPPDRVG